MEHAVTFSLRGASWLLLIFTMACVQETGIGSDSGPTQGAARAAQSTPSSEQPAP